MSNAIAETRYLPSRLVPGFSGYCPLTSVYGYVQPDGRFLAESWSSHEQKYYTPEDFVVEPGFLAVHLGSIEEDYTVETAASAIFNSVKSLFAACATPVDFVRIRTTVELSEYLKHYRTRYSHLMAIGHGSPEGLSFLDRPRPIGGSELAGLFGADQPPKPMQVISLCCHSGCESLAKGLSRGEAITDIIAPNREFDMRWAVHFVTGYFLERFLTGLSVEEAVGVAARNSGNAPMCLWRDGVLTGMCAKCATDSEPSVS